MLGIHHYGLFVATGVPLNLIPGQDTLYILGRSIAQGRRAGIFPALGISAGGLVHTTAAALGLSALLSLFSWGLGAIKLIGAGYLVYLGVRMLLSRTAAFGASMVTPSANPSSVFWQGMLTNVLNPKVALFFLAFIPQFIDSESGNRILGFLVLGLSFVTTGLIWCLVLAIGAAQIRGVLIDSPRMQNGLSKAVGALFIFLGVRLAASR